MSNPNYTTSIIPSNFSGASSIAIDHNDNIYIATFNNSTIYKIDNNGNQSIFVDTPYSNNISHLSFDNLGFANGGYLYGVINYYGNATLMFKVDINGNITEISHPRPYIGEITNVAFDSNNNMYYSTSGTNNNNKPVFQIVKVDTNGILTTLVDELSENIVQQVPPNNDTISPWNIALDSNDNIYLATQYSQLVIKYSSSGVLLNGNFISMQREPNPNDFGPSLISIDNDGNFYVSNWYTLNKYDNNGSFIHTVLIDPEVWISKVNFDSNGNLYFTNGPNGTLLSKYTKINVLPISNICFRKGTPVCTDQGIINIDKLNKQTHTIRNQSILEITKTLSVEKYLICIKKDAFFKNIPSQDTFITMNHKVYYSGKMHKARDLMKYNENIVRVKYEGEVLYNVVLEQYDKMIINNLIVETLHPENSIAQIYSKINCMTENERNKYIQEINKFTLENYIYNEKNGTYKGTLN